MEPSEIPVVRGGDGLLRSGQNSAKTSRRIGRYPKRKYSVSRLDPQKAAATLQDAIVLHRQGRLGEADKLYARILKGYPDQFDALHLSGLAKLQGGKAGEAHRLISAALKVAPQSADAHANLGLVLGALKRPDDALASFDKALALAPDHVEALGNRGNVLLDLGRTEEALANFDRLLAREPRHLPARVNRGNALTALGRLDEAVGEYDAALALNPNDGKACFSRAGALFRLGRYHEALAAFDRVLALAPQYAEAHLGRGQTLQALGRHTDALAAYQQASALKKDDAAPHLNAALALLTLGDYAKGFAEYEWRTKRPSLAHRNLGKPLWLGEYPLARRTILLHAEQGLGDTIMFARYVPLLVAGGAKVVLEVQAELKEALAQFDGVTVVARGEPLPPFDVHCPFGSLPLAFKTTLDSVPADIPYLRASEARIATWRPRLAALGDKRIGLAWAGNRSHVNDRNRSIGLSRLGPLLSTPGVTFVGLQRDVSGDDRDVLETLSDLRNVGEDFAEFSDTFAAVSSCDLVISVDSAVAHAAAAIGRPTFVLLPFWPDWRWGLSGDKSPWYPHARLFRQPADGDWDSVIARVQAEIAAMFAA
jgi:tetratricopeptide (TPR) repeat protein